ncbi:hypothetical protein IV38_GL002052 [Lactobacillus selangorensis]|uniref:Amino acid transporter n=1 Tax=Lactobacillus selangorensis TaxID=81857 RepID=A0A0R2FRC6_9LACO|nr:hypothetical protein IV38_GL002052 [Lactobacillus selangorensis]KRN30130.1 hypothetical protein IV40_GL001976 [Lactobacillus selangorensis]
MQKKQLNLFTTVMLALSAIIGSGWLFGSWEATKVAGPAAILSWIIGAVVIDTIAFNYIELGTMFPESGGMSQYAQYTHGSFVGFIAAWANWLSLLTIIPIEAVAAVQYMSSWPWSWANWTHRFLANGQITTPGLGVVFLFILVFTLLNYWSVSLLTHFTNFISIFKIGVPLLTIVTLLLSGFHPANFGHSVGTFFPYGTAAVFAATSVSGIIFSYNAFQTVINMGSEIKEPHKNIGRAITISLLISGVIYIMLQVTYIGSVAPKLLARVGWRGINFSSPFADIAILLGINWLAILLYVDAFVSPVGTGVSFVASTARVLASMSSGEHVPQLLGKFNRKYNTPRVALITNMVLSMVMVSVFRSWSLLANVISTSTLIAYLTGPVAVMALRRVAPDLKRPVHSKWLPFMAPFAFVLASLAIYWAMWPTTIEVIGVIVLGFPMYFFFEAKQQWRDTRQALKSGLWMVSYLVVLAVISYIGSRQFNGSNLLHYPWDFVIIIIVSLIFYEWGVHSSYRSPYFERALKINQNVRTKKD